VLLEPTTIYVKPVLELIGSEAEVRGLAHITSGGLGNLLRLEAEVGYRVDDPLPVPPLFELIRERGRVPDAEMHEVFNMGCGFCCVVAAADEGAALGLLRGHYPEAKRIGTVSTDAGTVSRG
jgi:phosphoribosylformylglycinamidine cyclo-ligase